MSKFNNFNYKFLLLLVLSTFLYPKNTEATAYSNVNISNNTQGSNNKVSVVNEVNTSVNTGGGGESRTDIRIETNGEVKEYHGTGDEDVTIESSNGNNSVRVNNKSGAQNSVSISNSPTSTPGASLSATLTPAPKDESNTKNLFGFIYRIQNAFRKIFNLVFGKN